MILLFMLLCPALAAVFVYTAELSRKRIAIISCASILLPLAASLMCVPSVYGAEIFNEEYQWIPELNFNFDLVADGLGLSLVILVLSISLLVMWFSYSYERKLRQFSAGLLLLVSAMLGVVMSANIFQFYFFWEVMIFPIYFIMSSLGEGKYKAGVATKFLVFMQIGALMILISFVWVYAVKGTVLFSEMDMEGVPSIIPVIILVGFCIKMGVFPLHSWLPDAHSEAPAPLLAMLSSLMVGLGGYAIIRVLVLTLELPAPELVIVMALFTMLYGGIMALTQSNLNRILAYSTISQMGYVLLGIGFSSTIGAAMHIFNHALLKSLLFLFAGAAAWSAGTSEISKLGGLSMKLRLPAFIGLLALAGLPPMAPFISEVMIFESLGMDVVTLLLAISAGVVTAAYTVPLLKIALSGGRAKARELPVSLWLPQLLLALLLVVFGLFPDMLIRLLGVMA